MSLVHAIPFAKCERAAAVITRQAALLGYEVESDQASTGTVYLTLKHKMLCECKDEECGGECADLLVRVADHEANEARYMYRINREPDYDIEVGFQAAAVRILAKKIGIDPATISYIRSQATRAAKKAAAKEEASRRRAEAAARWADECADRRAATIAKAAASLTHEEAAAIRAMKGMSRHEASIAVCRLLRCRADGIGLAELFEAADRK